MEKMVVQDMDDSEVKKSRLHYVDVAKGLLIVMVVFGHFWQHIEPLDADVAFVLRQANHSFIAFYMPAFFFITGYCSNFSRPVLATICHSFRMIMIPAFVFSVLSFLVSHHFDAQSIHAFLNDLLLYGGSFWFLTALFVARILYGTLSVFFNEKMLLIVCAFSFAVGFLLSDIPHEYEIWWFDHALLLMPFMAIGQIIRKQSFPFSKPFTCFVAYVIVLAATILLAHKGVVNVSGAYYIPIITQKLFNLNASMIPSLLLLTIAGILTVLSVSKSINSNCFLEYLGRNSLVIYCSHIIVLAFVCHNLGGALLRHNVMPIFAIAFVCFVITIFVCCCIAYLFNTRYLKFLIGKF